MCRLRNLQTEINILFTKENYVRTDLGQQNVDPICHRITQDCRAYPILTNLGLNTQQCNVVCIYEQGFKNTDAVSSPTPIWMHICLELGQIPFKIRLLLALSIEFIEFSQFSLLRSLIDYSQDTAHELGDFPGK